MKKLITLFSLSLLLMLPSCKSATYVAKADKGAKSEQQDPNVTHSVAISLPVRDSKPIGGISSRPATGTPSASFIPKASAFRMNGNYANYVAITLDANGNITYFPDPSDITPMSAPVSLADGWWLNRQGISGNSVFTKYTFEEYAALPQVPSIAELKEAIIPGSQVTEMISLPFNINEAQSHIPEINTYIDKEMKGDK